MKKILFVIAIMVMAFGVEAQNQRGLKGNKYHLDNYPQVTFEWNSPNPAVLDASQFTIFENDSAVRINVQHLPAQAVTPQKKSVLFVWEDMASHSQQAAFTVKMLTRFFNETQLKSEDQFNIAFFNRKGNNEPKVLKPLLSGFTNDKNALAKVLKDYKPSIKTFAPNPNQSDLYLAINEGIDMLKKEPADRAGVIVVISAGLNMKVPGASTEMETVRQNALDAGIPIYVMKYSIYGDTPEINTLAESTYGMTYATKKADDALPQLQQFYNGMDSRLHGQDYRISYTTTAKRDGKAHPVNFSINKVKQQIPDFTAPSLTFGLWIKENLILFIALCVGLILVVLLIVILISNKKKQDEMARQGMVNDMNNALSQSQQEMERMRQEQQAKERARAAAEQRKANEAEQQRLQSLMQSKNLYPRLLCQVNGQNYTYMLTKPVSTLGRNDNNDVVLNNRTVSGLHAEIRFNGNGFEIVNRSQSYTQGIIINGAFYQQSALKNGDMIGLGEAVLTFYM
ncbi:MAG: FHA domain-containing protein [Bacteroidales bacterium]|nr:FHA domain-containing protein [Bacteroidales bacterium]